MNLVPIEKQLEIAKRIFPANTHIELCEHPDDAKLKALVVDAFTIWECDVEVDLPPSILTSKPRKKWSKVKARGYHVDVSVPIMATRETPPDADVSDVGDFVNFFDALCKVAGLIVSDNIRQVQECYDLDDDLGEN
jgi:hypothetical protein